MKTRNPSIDAHIVALVETGHYNIAEQDRPFIQAMWGVYLYDANSVTHCCEFTPSYWLIHLYDEVLLTPAGKLLSDEQKAELYEKYESCPQEDGHYYHCHAIDAIPKERRHHYGRTGVRLRDVPRDDQMESLREHFCANHVL